MSTIHKTGFKSTVPPGEAGRAALERLRAAGHTGKVLSGPRFTQSDAQDVAGEFSVEYELADPT